MLGVIGGSGLYALEGLEIIAEHEVETPFGFPSAPIVEGLFAGQDILFLARHGQLHQFLPHEVNYRANIFALKQLGATRVLGVSAAGSLREDIKPGDLAIPSQYFDYTRGKREYTFFGNGIAGHVSTAYPVCDALSSDINQAASKANQMIHMNKTYACVEGPRLGTQAESFFLRDQAKCDLVGMTNVPEVFLAREAQMAYSTICVVTDFDCWMEDSSQHVSVEKFFEVYSGALEKAKSVLVELLKTPFSEMDSAISHSLDFSILTPDEALTEEQRQWLAVLRA